MRGVLLSSGSSSDQERTSKDIRLQLNEQLRCLDVRMEAQVGLVAELQDFFRKRAEAELDYSKSLDKLAKSLQLRHREQKQKREQWPLFSSYSCWQRLVEQTRSLSRDHAALAEVYSAHLVQRLQQVAEDVQRIYRRCREIGYETHEEILRVLQELHATMKTYHGYQGECRAAEGKLRAARNQQAKLEQAVPKEKLERSKKYRLIEKEVSKRKSKYADARLKALKARNEYLLCLEASNTTIHKYFVDDLSDLIDCMDIGFHSCVSRALLMHVSAENGRGRAVQTGAEQLAQQVQALDSRADKQRFLEANHQAFMIPKKLEFQGQRADDIANSPAQESEVELQKALRVDMDNRLEQLRQRLSNLRMESEEVWKTLETAETSLLGMLNAKDYECSDMFGDGASTNPKPPELTIMKARADRQETEDFYLTKFREYLLGTSRIARLDSKHEYLRQALQSEASEDAMASLNTSVGGGPGKPRRKRIGRRYQSGQPKLFGGSLEEYLEATNQEIPLIMKSSIRIINLYGLHHQGIFRVSGSQVEINNFRENFERGEDPLADMTDASDINSVAGVLKLYLRELREPLFPIIYFDHLMELARELNELESKHDFVIKMKDFIANLPRPVVIVMRYLFAFLNHLSEYCDENMMDPYNLAICFGPTLVPVPDDRDLVQFQNLVNELIKNIIVFYEDLFPKDGGILYEKYISKEPDDQDVGDSPIDHIQEDMDSEVFPSEDECDSLEATAQFDFIARSDRELSLRRGQHVTLFSQVSNDWWRGAVGGKEGLIPDKYISIKIKGEENKTDPLKSSSSEESMRRRGSSDASSHLKLHTLNSMQMDSPSSLDTATPSPTLSDPASLPGASSAPWTLHREKSSLGSPRLQIRKSLPSTNSEDLDKPKCIDQKPPPIYAEPHKPNHSAIVDKTNMESTLVVEIETRENGCVSSSDVVDAGNDNGITSPSPTTSDPGDLDDATVEMRRKTHTKSQSISDARLIAEIDENNVSFNQNRELWQMRASSQSSHGLNKTFPIRHAESWGPKRTAPDLVMDLPLTGTTSPKDNNKKTLSASTGSLSDHSSSEEDTTSICTVKILESPDMSTAAERFAKQNQCTLKKNTKTLEKPRAEVKPVAVLTCEDPSRSLEGKISPVPPHNTQKFVNKFADLHLTGGSAMSVSSTFKPQLKVKPHVLRKPMVMSMPQVQSSPELSRKANNQD
ncbi:SLIT-ROBO Rho GTPase-activating protein 1-like isoform X4 [Ctenocephalides felis]|uniref:SLIT-ROBO Rho GTPase-activating protein 1-like isoform X4 n=1 Tax=Ctenocephalides felis TaxID=7515 RepID=UPI000E6E2AF2|nr:SLIT-ROBO Rho GTPase-activating protein 1-like isoform X4 [Ctenocephalides felis]